MKDGDTEKTLDLSLGNKAPFHETGDNWVIILKHRFQHISFGHSKAEFKREFLISNRMMLMDIDCL